MKIRYLSCYGLIVMFATLAFTSCKIRKDDSPAKEDQKEEILEEDFEADTEVESEAEAEAPDTYSAQVLRKWSGDVQLAWCDSETDGDPYCEEEIHTQWQPNEGTGYFQNKDYVYSRIRQTWNLSDTLWVYLIETKPTDYRNLLNGPLYVVAFLKPPSSEIDAFLKLGLKGSNGVGPESVSVVRDRTGEVYLRSLWTEMESGVESAFLEYHSLFDSSRRLRFKISENNHADCDSIHTPCYAYRYTVEGEEEVGEEKAEGAILRDTLLLHGSGIIPDPDNLLRTIDDTTLIIVDRPTTPVEKFQCPEYLSRDSVLVPGSRLFGKLVSEPKMLIGGGLVERLPLDPLNANFESLRLKSSNTYPLGTVEQGTFAAGQHPGMFMQCGYWWKEDARRKSGGYRDSAWLATYFIPLPDHRTVSCFFAYRYTGNPESAFCELN